MANYVSSYIPTLGASVTRSADSASKTGISSLIGTEFTIFYDGFETIGGQATRYLVLKGSGGTYANAVFIEGSSGNSLALSVLNNASANVFAAISASLTNGQRMKFAVRCKDNDFAFYVNGSLVAAQASGSVPTTADLYLGNYVDFADNYSLPTTAAIYTSGLSNSELATLTSL